jgi:peptidoglycan/xylan/chitin deacetylase (PgdA/CDA1 family)
MPSYIARDLGLERRHDFVARGHHARHFFPHRVVRLPKAGPDGRMLAQRMYGPVAPDQLWELVLYALPPVLDEFPADLFFDDDVVWHQQQFGLQGQVATVNLVERPPDLYAMVLVSDVVQRIGRRRELKTRIENRFAGWARLLINAACDFALDRGLRRVHVATADWALRHTDRSRAVQRPLFDRVYDASVGEPFRAVRQGQWWVLDAADNAGVVVRPDRQVVALSDEPQICMCHDVERGWGHRRVEPRFAAAADDEAPGHLRQMLEIEAAHGVRATYNVVGALLPDVGAEIAAHGHCIAFHSYDHDDGIHQCGASDHRCGDGQLDRCRDVDYRIKGYRPPGSNMTDLTDEQLAFYNFEWVASSRYSLRVDRPLLERGIVHVPILFDDFDLHEGGAYAEWEHDALRALSRYPTAVFSLHDCYGDRWLPSYPALLRTIGGMGRLRTVDELAADVLLSQSV